MAGSENLGGSGGALSSLHFLLALPGGRSSAGRAGILVAVVLAGHSGSGACDLQNHV